MREWNPSRDTMRLFTASALLLLALTVCLSGLIARSAQTDKPQPEKPQPAKTQGRLLVASRGLGDPFFSESVVLMLPIKEGTLLVGLIVNKPTKLKLRDVFPNAAALQKSDTPAYFGGPVDFDVAARSAIFRSKTPPKDATLVFADVYAVFDPDTIAALADDPKQASSLRVFLGRSQWDPQQFQAEVSIGAWHSILGGTDSVFSALPEALWRTLIDNTEPKPVVQVDPFLSPAAAFEPVSAPAI